VLDEPARHHVGVVAVQVQVDRGTCVGSTFQYRPDQARLEAGEELQCAQRGLAATVHFRRLPVAQKQALVLAQRLLDLVVARQRGIVKDPQPLRGLALGHLEIADPAFGHQPGCFMGQALAALAGAALRVQVRMDVLAAVRHRGSSRRPDPTLPEPAVPRA
jgi:hypothetical protein